MSAHTQNIELSFSRTQSPQHSTAGADGRHIDRRVDHVPQPDPDGAHDVCAWADGAAIVRMNGVAQATVPACLRKSRRLCGSTSRSLVRESLDRIPRPGRGQGV
jgi:hypothetical protein